MVLQTALNSSEAVQSCNVHHLTIAEILCAWVVQMFGALPGMANITAALRAAGRWDDALLWVSSDNGGRISAQTTATCSGDKSTVHLVLDAASC